MDDTKTGTDFARECQMCLCGRGADIVYQDLRDLAEKATPGTDLAVFRAAGFDF
jgi:hypothetical protein